MKNGPKSPSWIRAAAPGSGGVRPGGASSSVLSSKLAQSDAVLEAIGDQKGAQFVAKSRSKPAGDFRWHQALGAYLRIEVPDRFELLGSDVATLWALVVFADYKGRCWPKQKTLAAVAGVSVAAARRSLKKLELRSLIEVESHAGRGQANGYQLCIPGVLE